LSYTPCRVGSFPCHRCGTFVCQSLVFYRKHVHPVAIYFVLVLLTTP
jgi:hypothetical protein